MVELCGGRLPREIRLGLRRRQFIRADAPLRLSRRLQTLCRSRPRGRPRRHSRRRLQSPGAGRELSEGVRGRLLHRPLHDRLGRRNQFRRENAEPVREYFIANAGYWIDEFHLDGLRLDATQNIYDLSDDHILAAVTRRARSSREGVRSSSSPKTSRRRRSSSGRKSRAVTEWTRSGTTISITARWWR